MEFSVLLSKIVFYWECGLIFISDLSSELEARN